MRVTSRVQTIETNTEEETWAILSFSHHGLHNITGNNEDELTVIMERTSVSVSQRHGNKKRLWIPLWSTACKQFQMDRNSSKITTVKCGGLAAFINNKWCHSRRWKEHFISPDTELLPVGLIQCDWGRFHMPSWLSFTPPILSIWPGNRVGRHPIWRCGTALVISSWSLGTQDHVTLDSVTALLLSQGLLSLFPLWLRVCVVPSRYLVVFNWEHLASLPWPLKTWLAASCLFGWTLGSVSSPSTHQFTHW